MLGALAEDRLRRVLPELAAAAALRPPGGRPRARRSRERSARLPGARAPARASLGIPRPSRGNTQLRRSPRRGTAKPRPAEVLSALRGGREKHVQTLDGQDGQMTSTDPRWLDVSPPLAIDDDDPDAEPPEAPPTPQPPNLPPPDLTPAETPQQGSQDVRPMTSTDIQQPRPSDAGEPQGTATRDPSPVDARQALQDDARGRHAHRPAARARRACRPRLDLVPGQWVELVHRRPRRHRRRRGALALHLRRRDRSHGHGAAAARPRGRRGARRVAPHARTSPRSGAPPRASAEGARRRPPLYCEAGGAREAHRKARRDLGARPRARGHGLLCDL